MNLITRLFAFALCVALAFSSGATTTFTSPTTKGTPTPTATTASNGIIVTLSGAGWIYSDAIAAGSSAQTYWSTVTANGGTWTGVGIAVTGGTGCSATPTGTNTASFVGGYATSGTASACPSDWATYYTGAVPSSPTASTSLITTAVPLNTAVAWVLTAPTTSGNAVGITVQAAGTASATTISPLNGDPTVSTNYVAKAAASAHTFAFYVEAQASGTVCFQTNDQHTKSGACSGVHFSVAISGLVAMIALIFFN